MTTWFARAAAALPQAPPAAGTVQLWLMSLDAPPWPGAELHALLDAEERARADRFRFEVHRRRFVHARGLLRKLLGSALCIAPADVRLAYGPQGKPRLAPAAAPDGGGAMHAAALDFNLSHSGGWALLALSDGAAVGADIEVPHPMRDLVEIADHFFAPAERAALRSLPSHQWAAAFLACWTRKEAFVKALGGGLSVALDSFDVALLPGEPARLLRSADPAHPIEDFTLWAGTTPDRCPCAVVVRSGGAVVQTFELH